MLRPTGVDGYVDQLLATRPPLTSAQREQLRQILRARSAPPAPARAA